jgi:hypothetical protein
MGDDIKEIEKRQRELDEKIKKIPFNPKPNAIEKLFKEILSLENDPPKVPGDKTSLRFHYCCPLIRGLSQKLHISTAVICEHDSFPAYSERCSRVQNWIDKKQADRRLNKMLWIALVSAIASIISAVCAYVAISQINHNPIK